MPAPPSHFLGRPPGRPTRAARARHLHQIWRAIHSLYPPFGVADIHRTLEGQIPTSAIQAELRRAFHRGALRQPQRGAYALPDSPLPQRWAHPEVDSQGFWRPPAARLAPAAPPVAPSARE